MTDFDIYKVVSRTQYYTNIVAKYLLWIWNRAKRKVSDHFMICKFISLCELNHAIQNKNLPIS